MDATVISDPATGDPAVVVSGLVKSYHGRRVVDDLSWCAERGQVTAVLGPNGAGKTTALECCEGLRRPDAGSVRVLGLDPITDAARLRPRIGVMVQDGGLPTGAGARALLAHVAALHARPQPPAELLDLLGLSDHAGTRIRRLSGGQRQRLALALAIVGRPEVAFLDEPTAGLDPAARRVVRQVIQRLRADGVAVVLTTHLLEDVEQLADQVIVMDGGRLVVQGSPAELAGADEVLSFTATDLDLAALAAVLGAQTRISCVEAEPGSGAMLEYQVRSVAGGALDPAAVAATTTWFAQQGRVPERLRLGRSSLEDVFLELTDRSLR